MIQGFLNVVDVSRGHLHQALFDAGAATVSRRPPARADRTPAITPLSAETAKSAERKKKHSRWFKKAQAWRTGCEGRISVLKRRHGLTRCRYHGAEGMKRWVGLGVMADTPISMGNVLVART